MATYSELSEALNADELKPLMASTGVNARALLQRALHHRREEIELEMSKTTAARDAAVAIQKSAEADIAVRTSTGLHPARLTAGLFVVGLAAIMALVSVLSGWSAGRLILDSWATPFASAWPTGVIWGLLYIAAFIIAWEIDFYLRRLPKRVREAEFDTGLTAHRSEVDVAVAARRAQLVELVRDHVTEILNASQGPSFDADLRVRVDDALPSHQRVTLAVGLSEVINDDNRVATDAQRRLIHLFTSQSGASIGISGPRGVGKSTLLATMCGANLTINGRTAIAISTSAPVEYDGRDFLLHLFSSLCRQVLRTEGQEGATVEAHARLEARRWRRSSLLEALPTFARLLGFAGLCLAAAGLFLSMLQSLAAPPDAVARARSSLISAHSASAAPSGVPVLDETKVLNTLGASPLFTLGVLAMVLSLVVIFARRPGPLRQAIFGPELSQRAFHPGDRDELVERALRELHNVAFQRSYTSGWSGSLKVPTGFELGASDGLMLAQRPESLPELVDRFRGFVGEVVRAYDNIVLIGIDELDKLQSAQHAEAFLNGVKSVFGIKGCFYLISVSEHALAAFERRGMGFRDAFDSALDDILQLDFLNLDQSRVLLNRRILRLPDPFLQLCHMLSGGLPRDLIRQARALLDCATEQPNGAMNLIIAADQLAARDLTARLRATSIAMRTIKELPETSALLVEVASLPAAATISIASRALIAFRDHVARLSNLRNNEDGQILVRLAEELAAYYDIMVELRRVAGLLSTYKGWERASELGLANQVARVRQALELGAPLAEAELANLRKSVDNVDRHPPDGLQRP